MAIAGMPEKLPPCVYALFAAEPPPSLQLIDAGGVFSLLVKDVSKVGLASFSDGFGEASLFDLMLSIHGHMIFIGILEQLEQLNMQ